MIRDKSHIDPIGGEFQIEPERFDAMHCRVDEGRPFASGRSALRAILREAAAEGHRSIGLPEYICGSVVEAVKAEGFIVERFPVTPWFRPDVGSIAELAGRGNRLVLVVDYFGCLSLAEEIRAIQVLGIEVVLDKVQAFHEPSDFGADYWFTGYRKFFAVPEGARAFSRSGEIPASGEASEAGAIKAIGGLLKATASLLKMEDAPYLSMLELGESIFDKEREIKTAGKLFLGLASTIDVEAAFLQRKKNHCFLQQGLSELGLSPLLCVESEKSAPLVLPVAIDERDKVRRALMADRIYLPVHWPGANLSGFAGFLAEHELGLVLDQRYDEEDMTRLLEALERAGARSVVYDR